MLDIQFRLSLNGSSRTRRRIRQYFNNSDFESIHTSGTHGFVSRICFFSFWSGASEKALKVLWWNKHTQYRLRSALYTAFKWISQVIPYCKLYTKYRCCWRWAEVPTITTDKCTLMICEDYKLYSTNKIIAYVNTCMLYGRMGDRFCLIIFPLFFWYSMHQVKGAFLYLWHTAAFGILESDFEVQLLTFSLYAIAYPMAFTAFFCSSSIFCAVYSTFWYNFREIIFA